MLGIGFVCLFVGTLMFSNVFVCFWWDLCWVLGFFCLFVGQLCLAVRLFLVGLVLGIGFVCLFVGALTFEMILLFGNKHS